VFLFQSVTTTPPIPTCHPSLSKHRRANPWSPLPLAPPHTPLPGPQGCHHPPPLRSPCAVRAPPCQCPVPTPSPSTRTTPRSPGAPPPLLLTRCTSPSGHRAAHLRPRTAPPSSSSHHAEACHAGGIEPGLSPSEHRTLVTVPAPRRSLPHRQLGVTGTSPSRALLLFIDW
jgi:hypothetical protein